MLRPNSKRAQVLKDYRLTKRGEEGQGQFSSNEVWISQVSRPNYRDILTYSPDYSQLRHLDVYINFDLGKDSSCVKTRGNQRCKSKGMLWV